MVKTKKEIKQYIERYIKNNEHQRITADVLCDVLCEMVDGLTSENDNILMSGRAENSGVQKGGNYAYGVGSIACGEKSVAHGPYSHAEGYNTITNNPAEHSQGQYNISNTDTIHSIGVGKSDNDRKNAVEVLKDGKVYIIGLGGFDGTNADDPTIKSLQDILSTLNI